MFGFSNIVSPQTSRTNIEYARFHCNLLELNYALVQWYGNNDLACIAYIIDSIELWNA